MSEKKKTLSDIVSIQYITPENAEITEKNEFLALRLTLANESGENTVKEYDRIFLHRAFPFDSPESFISVQDQEKNEIGMISEIGIFPEETAALLRRELSRKYYSPILTGITAIRKRYGYAYCTAITAHGPISFTLRDVERSITRIDDKQILITDIDGNRYSIPDISKLDRKSFRQIELYI